MAAPLSAAEVQKQMAANSAAWKTATPQMQTQLHQANLDLAKQTGQSYNAAQGTYSAPVTAKPISATTTAPTTKPVIPMTPEVAARETASTQGRAVDWINNPKSGIGGLDAYTAKQNERYAGALSANDTDLMGRLTADSQRVGYKLNTPTATEEIPKAVSAVNSYQPPDYAALAAARTAAALAQKRTIADQQKSSLDRSYGRANQITQDNRTLENGQINRTLSPFSGKTAFDKGIIGRERTLADESSQNNLLAQKSNIDQLLADYENATAEEQVRIADELQARDRQYQLDLAAQTGNLRDLTTGQTQRTIAGQTLDYNQSPNNPNNIGQVLQNQGQAQQNQLNQYKLDDYPVEQAANVEKIKRESELGKMDVETARYNLNQLKDPNSPKNQAAKLELEMKKLDASNYPEEVRIRLQTAQKTLNEIGVVRYKPQTADEIAYDKLQVDKITQEIENLKTKGDKAPTTAEEYDKNLKPQYDSEGKLTNAQQIEDQIILSGMSDYEQFRSYKKYGIPWDDPIPQAPGK